MPFPSREGVQQGLPSAMPTRSAEGARRQELVVPVRGPWDAETTGDELSLEGDNELHCIELEGVAD
ncbi:MAG: hypothetical protein MK194_00430 [Roseibacillus sp.]|nr:hypothetical protein [Roseibacillus sp.]